MVYPMLLANGTPPLPIPIWGVGGGGVFCVRVMVMMLVLMVKSSKVPNAKNAPSTYPQTGVGRGGVPLLS